MKVDKSTWTSIPFSDCVRTIKVNDAVQKKDYQATGLYPIISQEKDFISGYCNNVDNLNKDFGELVIFGDHTRIIKFVDFDFCVGADGVKVLRPFGNLDAKFLYYFLLWADIPSNGYSRHFKFIKELKIPHPPIDNQYDIAGQLDTLQEVIDGYREQIADLDALVQSIFLGTFGDPVENPKGWDVSRLRDIALIGTGATPSRKHPKYYNGDISWVKSTEVNNSYIFNTQDHITSEAIDNSNCKVYPKNTVLIAMYGQRKTRGQVGLLKIAATTNQACAAIQCKSNLDPVFAYWHLQMCYEANRQLGHGTNQKNMNLSIVGNLNFILPSIELQQQFASQVEAIEKQKDLLRQQLADAEMLMAERMQYYFS